MTRTYFYLVDPAGVRYEVPFDTDRPLTIVDWLPGTATAVAMLGGPSDPSGIAVVDLEAGTIKELPLGDAAGGATAQLAADGTVLVVSGDQATLARFGVSGKKLASVPVDGSFARVVLDASRTKLAVTSDAGVRLLGLDLVALDAPRAAANLAERGCVSATWIDEDTLNAGCPVPGAPGTFEHWSVPLAGRPTLVPVGTTPSSDGVVVLRVGARTFVYQSEVEHEDGTTTPPRVSEITPAGTLTPFAPLAAYQHVSGGLLVGPLLLPGGRYGDLVSVDPATGAVVVVDPRLDPKDNAEGVEVGAYQLAVVAH